MRKDMHKILVEPPRRGRDAEIAVKGRAARDPEDLPSFESIRDGRRRGWNRKEPNTNINPLRRFLVKQVGRRWNDVFSEICVGNDARSKVKFDVRDRALSCVDTVTWLGDDGRRYTNSIIGPLCIGAGDLFVDEDGILRRCDEPRSWRHRWKSTDQETEKTVVKIDDWRMHHKLDGLWFEVFYKPVPEPAWVETILADGTMKRQQTNPAVFDIIEEKLVHRLATSRERGRTRYAHAKRQLSHEEMKAAGLANDGEAACQHHIEAERRGGDRKSWRRRLAARITRA